MIESCGQMTPRALRAKIRRRMQYLSWRQSPINA